MSGAGVRSADASAALADGSALERLGSAPVFSRWPRTIDLIEDDYNAELRYDIRPIQAIKGIDAGDQVIYVGTLSKTIFPSLRLGYLVSPTTSS